MALHSAAPAEGPTDSPSMRADVLATRKAAHVVRHDQDRPVAPGRGNSGEPDAGVAAGRLHDHAAGLQPAVALGRLNHAEGDAVFDAAARVKNFELGEKPARQFVFSFKAREANEGRAAHEFRNPTVDLTHDSIHSVQVYDGATAKAPNPVKAPRTLSPVCERRAHQTDMLSRSTFPLRFRGI